MFSNERRECFVHYSWSRIFLFFSFTRYFQYNILLLDISTIDTYFPIFYFNISLDRFGFTIQYEILSIFPFPIINSHVFGLLKGKILGKSNKVN